jgi:hypothetical protein
MLCLKMDRPHHPIIFISRTTRSKLRHYLNKTEYVGEMICRKIDPTIFQTHDFSPENPGRNGKNKYLQENSSSALLFII